MDASQYLNRRIWPTSLEDMDSGCNEDKTFVEAESICAAADGRLCTLNEMRYGVTRGAGCGFNNDLIWSKQHARTPGTCAACALGCLSCSGGSEDECNNWNCTSLASECAQGTYRVCNGSSRDRIVPESKEEACLSAAKAFCSGRSDCFGVMLKAKYMDLNIDYWQNHIKWCSAGRLSLAPDPPQAKEN